MKKIIKALYAVRRVQDIKEKLESEIMLLVSTLRHHLKKGDAGYKIKQRHLTKLLLYVREYNPPKMGNCV